MNMSPRTWFTISLLAALPACGDEPLPPTGNEGACPLTAPTLLAAAPEYFKPRRDTYYDLLAVGDELLFTFDPPDDPDRIYWRKHRCGGEPERYPPIAPGLHNIIGIDTPEGPLLYANNTDHEYFILDRLAVPGDDPRRPVLGLPRERMKAYGKYPYAWSPDASYVLFYQHVAAPDSDHRYAAGVNSDRGRLHTHAGDPDVPAWHLGDTIVQLDVRDDLLLLLHDDGTLERAYPRTAERTPLLTNVRAFSASPDGKVLIWQAIGDGISESVYLRHLGEDDDIEIAINDFNAVAWDPAPAGGFIGSWWFTADSAHAALVGPEGAYVAAVRTDTGAPVEIPESLLWGFTSHILVDHEFVVRLPDPEQNVHALWDPATGGLRVWYRGPAEHPLLEHIDGDLAEVFISSPDEYGLGTLHRVDLVTGETHELFPQIAYWHYKGEREYLSFHMRSVFDYRNPQLTFYSTDILAIDVETHAMRRLVDDTPAFASFDDGLVFLDLFSDEPGLRAIPRP